MNIREVPEPRRWAAFHCFGSYGQLMEVQAGVEDLEGALDAGQIPVAKYAGMAIVRKCLGLRSLLAAGVPPDSGDLLADEFAGLTDERLTEGLTLSARMARSDNLDTLRALAKEVFKYVHEFERDLGFATTPPSVRRPGGLFPALRLAREILPINQAAGLPLALPAEWLPTLPAAAEAE